MPAQRICALVATCFFLNPASSASFDDPTLVHPLAEPDHWEITGASAFSPEAIRRGIRRKTEYLQVTFPQTKPERIAGLVRELIERGYQHKGFANVRVGTSIGEDGERLRIQIDEGPQFSRGVIRLTGTKQIDPKRFAEFCTTIHPITDETVVLRINKDNKPDLIRNPAGAVVVPEANYQPTAPATAPIWAAAKNQSLVKTALDDQLKFLRQAFEDQGFYHAKFSFEAKANQTTQAVDLHVQVEEEGRPAIIRTIETRGLDRNSQATLLKHLQLARGQRIGDQRCRALERAIHASARFAWCACRVVPWNGETGEVDLYVDVREHPGAPKLGEKLSPEQQVLVRAAHWLSDWETSDYDLVLELQAVDLIELTGKAIDEEVEASEPEKIDENRAEAAKFHAILNAIAVSKVKIVSSGRDGLYMLFHGRDGQAVAAILATGKHLLGWTPDGGLGLQATEDNPLPQLLMMIGLRGTPDNAANQYQHITFGLGFTSDKSRQTEKLHADPAAMLDFLRTSDAARVPVQATLESGVLKIAGDVHNVQFDEKTGRLLAASWGPLQVRTEKRSLPAVRQRMEQALQRNGIAIRETKSGEFQNLVAQQLPAFRDLVAFIVKDTPNEWMLQLADYDVWRPMGDYLGTLFGDDVFLIPGQTQTVENAIKQQVFGQLIATAASHDSTPLTSTVIGVFGNMLMNFLTTSFDLFPVRSMPWIVNREVDLLISSQGKSGFGNIVKLQRSPKFGPLSGLYATTMLGRLSPYWQKPFALSALKQIDEFENDQAWLLEEGSVPETLLKTLAEAFRRLDDETVKQFLDSSGLGTISPADVAAIRRPLLEHRGPLTREVLSEFTNALWHHWLLVPAEQRLESIAWADAPPQFVAASLRVRGVARMQKRNLTSARRDFTRAIEIIEGLKKAGGDPDSLETQKLRMMISELHVVLAMTYVPDAETRSGKIVLSMQLEEAIDAVRTALKDYPENTFIGISGLSEALNVARAQLAAVYALKATTLMDLGRYEAALGFADQAIELLNEHHAGIQSVITVPAHAATKIMLIPLGTQLAWTLSASPDQNQRSGKKALALAEKLYEIAGPDDVAGLMALAAAHAEMGNLASARKWQQQALQKSPKETRQKNEALLARISAGLPVRDERIIERKGVQPAGLRKE